jgi:hypothetical protein
MMDEYLRIFGPDKLQHMQTLRYDTARGKAVRRDEKAKRSAIAAHYRKEHERMKEQRHAGVMGRIEFNWFDPLDI